MSRPATGLQGLGELIWVLQYGAWHLRCLEQAWQPGGYLDDPRPYAWREILACVEEALDPETWDDDPAPGPEALARELVDLLLDVVAALDHAAPEDPAQPSRLAVHFLMEWMGEKAMAGSGR